ncbi:hypothetical protein F4X86_02065 [Candidatus Saccharibacteria bacterium]|nr:hypothetical protein [Candidatus Saccharibacteria bacterium]
MRLNNRFKRDIRLIAVTLIIGAAATVAAFIIAGWLADRREAGEYRAYNDFCQASGLRFFEGLALLPTGTQRNTDGGLSDGYLSQAFSDATRWSEVEIWRTGLDRQIEAVAAASPPPGLVFLHEELALRLNAAADFGDILLSRRDSGWPVKELTAAAREYFDSLRRIILLMEVVETEALSWVPACGWPAGFNLRDAENYVLEIWQLLNQSEAGTAKENKDPVLIGP